MPQKIIRPIALSLRSAARALDLPPKRITDATRSGALTPHLVGTRYLYLASDLETWVRSLPVPDNSTIVLRGPYKPRSPRAAAPANPQTDIDPTE